MPESSISAEPTHRPPEAPLAVNLSDLRRSFALPFAMLVGAVGAIATLIAFGRGANWQSVGLFALGATALALLPSMRSPAALTTRWTSTVMLMVQISLLVYAAAGTTYQTDLHMAYFAAPGRRCLLVLPDDHPDERSLRGRPPSGPELCLSIVGLSLRRRFRPCPGPWRDRRGRGGGAHAADPYACRHVRAAPTRPPAARRAMRCARSRKPKGSVWR